MKSDIKHRMIRRLNGWDYCQRAIYSITVTLADRSRPWLVRLIEWQVMPEHFHFIVFVVSPLPKPLRRVAAVSLPLDGGRRFDICAQGRLLLLAPAAWPYSTQEKDMTRFDATALNRICQWFAGEDAVEVNYHGMRPSNIDRLAEEAVLAETP